MYEGLGTVEEYLSSPTSTFSRGWAFGLFGAIVKNMGFSVQDYFMLFAFLTVIPYVLFVRKYCPDFLFGVFLMFTTGFYAFTFAAMKQCIATAICISILPFAAKKKWLIFIPLVGVASLFHPYALIYLLVPFMVFKPFTQRTYIYMAAFVIAGFSLDSLLGTVLSVTDMMGADYDATTFTGEGVNIFRILVSFVPMVMGVFYRHTLFEESSDSENMIFNLSMLNALIMFVGMFGTANYFGRLANYFLPAQVVVIPWMLNKVDKQDGRILKYFCVVGYFGYFVYENLLREFDLGFNQISLVDYIKSHLPSSSSQ